MDLYTKAFHALNVEALSDVFEIKCFENQILNSERAYWEFVDDMCFKIQEGIITDHGYALPLIGL